jgi:Flp pilus assembly protein CpaB
MALAQKRIIKNKRTIVLAVALLLIGVVVVIAIGNGGLSWPTSKTITNSLTTGGLVLEGSDLPIYAELGADVLDDARLNQLELHGVFPLTPGQPGRSSPFVQAAPK